MAQATAKLNYLHMAPRKVRLLASSIRGLSVNEAEAQLLFRSRRAALPLLKLLRSCVANAKMQKLDVARLVVARITVDQGPMLKRSLPRAMGRATPLQKKMSHVVVVLEEHSTVSAPRFTVVKKEKPKRGSHEHKTPKASKTATDIAAGTAKEKPGFFKRIFNRKAV